MTYKEYIENRAKEMNELPIFFAFSNKQFKAAMEERGLTENDTDKIYRLGGSGGFYLKKDADEIRAYFKKADVLQEYMKDPKFAEEAFRYEMDNHEYTINWQGDYDVCTCFCKCEYSDDKDYEDYLSDAGMADLIPAYVAARKSHIENFTG